MAEIENTQGLTRTGGAGNALPLLGAGVAGGVVAAHSLAAPAGAKTVTASAKIIATFLAAAKIAVAKLASQAIVTAGNMTWTQAALIAGSAIAVYFAGKGIIGAFRGSRNIASRSRARMAQWGVNRRNAATEKITIEQQKLALSQQRASLDQQRAALRQQRSQGQAAPG